MLYRQFMCWTFLETKTHCPAITSTMVLVQDVLNQKTETWYLSHIRAHSKLPRILTQGNEITETIILTASMDLLEQAKTLHQQFHLSPQNLHRLLPKLSISWCKHLSQPCATWASLAPLEPLKCAGVNSRGLMLYAIWQMDVITMSSFAILNMFMRY